MHLAHRGRLVPALALVAVLAATGCGCNDHGGSSTGSKAPKSGPGSTVGTKVVKGKQGGAITYLSSGDVDYLDPGQTYYTFGYMIHYAVNRTLYSFKPDDSVHPVPDLATGP